MAIRPIVNTGLTEHKLMSEIDNSIRGGFVLLAKILAVWVCSNNPSPEATAKTIGESIEDYAYQEQGPPPDPMNVLAKMKERKG